MVVYGCAVAVDNEHGGAIAAAGQFGARGKHARGGGGAKLTAVHGVSLWC